jgi:hypothetical protein
VSLQPSISEKSLRPISPTDVSCNVKFYRSFSLCLPCCLSLTLSLTLFAAAAQKTLGAEPYAENPGKAGNGNVVIGPEYDVDPDLTDRGKNDLRARDPEETYHNWVMANQRTVAALEAKGYDYRYVFSRATRHCDKKVFEQTLADTLVWMWRGYHAE